MMTLLGACSSAQKVASSLVGIDCFDPVNSANHLTGMNIDCSEPVNSKNHLPGMKILDNRINGFNPLNKKNAPEQTTWPKEIIQQELAGNVTAEYTSFRKIHGACTTAEDS